MKKMMTLLSIFTLINISANSISDTQFDKQWGLINSGQAIPKTVDDLTDIRVNGTAGKDIRWDQFKNKKIPSDREVIVAVIDSGVDITHPDLQGRIWKDEERCPGEDTSKGFCHGYNALDKNDNLVDDTGHGTHVAGIVAANKNGFGVVGVSHPQVKIMPVKVLSNKTKSFIYNGRLMTDIIADGIRYAVENGASVLNLSLGWPKILETKKIQIALKNAIDKNVIVVVASGNNNKEIPTFPCTSDGVICVGAIDNTGEVASFSNYGGKVDILAPGEFIVSTYPTTGVESRILRINGYESKKGTSQASPFVAGIAANYKLLYPESTGDQFKAQLLGSADQINQDSKRTKFGLVNMKEIMKNNVKEFIAPNFKNLLDIKVRGDNHSFSLILPIKNFLSDVENVKVKLSSDQDFVNFMKADFDIPKLREGESYSLMALGSVTSLDVDSNISINVEISINDKVISQTSTSLMLAREWERVPQDKINKVSFGNVPAKVLARFTQTRKLTNIKRVSDKYNQLTAAEYWFEDPRVNSKEFSTVSIFQERENSFKKVDLKMPLRSKILTVFVNDTNLDGKFDYLVYSLGAKEENIYFDHFDHDGNKLFGEKHSAWQFPISTFAGLPLENGFLEAFKWMKVKSDLGNVLVPAYHKVFSPADGEEQREGDILDIAFDEKFVSHIYYLKPRLENDLVKVDYLKIDNMEFLDKLIDQGFINDWDNISVEKLLPQSPTARSKGEINFFISIGSDFLRKYIKIKVSEVDDINIVKSDFPFHLIAGNNNLPISSLDNLGVYNGEVSFVVMYDRQNGRYVRYKEGRENIVENFKSNGWNNPVFNTIAQYDDELSSLFLETRYHVQASTTNKDGEKKNYVLPINRDSAFPGVNFSETLQSVTVQRDGQKLGALHIDSTLIFGDRIYHMVFDGTKFYRPLALTFSIPRQCALLDPVARKKEGSWAYSLLCLERGGRASINYYPLKY
tara:strand:- start:29613 stop:32516 length:2904 start_codon:yes stop_codon:yes gene_type:complete